MPCSDYRDDEEELKILKARCDKLARIACNALQNLEYLQRILVGHSPKVPPKLTQETFDWWKEHKAKDGALK